MCKSSWRKCKMDIKRPTWRQSQWKLKILPHDPPIPPRCPRAPKPSPQINTLGAQVAQVRLSCLNPDPGGTRDGGVGNRFCRDATVPHCWRGRWVLVAPHPRAGAGPVVPSLWWSCERQSGFPHAGDDGDYKSSSSHSRTLVCHRVVILLTELPWAQSSEQRTMRRLKWETASENETRLHGTTSSHILHNDFCWDYSIL